MKDFEQQINALKMREAYLVGKREVTQTQLDTARERYSTAKKEYELYSKCSKLLTETSMLVHERTTQKIADIVTQLYRAVFGGDDSFVIKVDTKRKTPIAEFFIKTKKAGKEVLLDPIMSDGGGKMDVIALGLRIAALLLYKPALNRVLILDEPLRFISSSSTSEFPFRYRAVSFFLFIAKTYGIQILAVTHDSELVDLADIKFELELTNEGYTKVTKDSGE